MGVNSQERIEQGRLLMFDADEVLNRLLVGNRPDAERFENTINPILDRAAGGRKRLVRIYRRDGGRVVEQRPGRGGAIARDSVASAHRKTQVLASLRLFVGRLPDRRVQLHL